VSESVPPLPCSIDELRTLFLFEKLTEDQLGWLCREGRVEHIGPGLVFGEGEPADCFYVLFDGEVVLSRRVGADDVEITRTSDPGVYAGAMQVYLGDRVPQAYTASLRATRLSRFFVLSAAGFGQMMRDWFPMMLHLLDGMFIVSQRERLLALGSLSADLTHELNNPAAAALRAIPSLRERVAGMRQKLEMMVAGPDDRYALAALTRLRELAALARLQEQAAERASKAPTLSPLAASDAEDEVADWLQAHRVADGWRLAPVFVQAGLDTGWLDQVAAAVDGATLDGALRWLTYTAETELLMDEIEDSTTRISSLVDAAKQYSQLDQAPYRIIDVHKLLDSTLLMMSRRLAGITVVKDYDRGLPQIPVYAAELNQVWTNLIDNAVSAMGGAGTLTVRTALDADLVLVEIGDTGPGVPAEIRERIFEPFFTTKQPGEGTGLGLDICWRIVVKKHHGDLQVESEPGDTRFQVRLPLTAADAERAEPP
jgi:signal transduction histidine kinase